MQQHPRGRVASPLNSILWFASSNFFRQVMNAGVTFLRPTLMSPTLFGLFSTLRLVPTYSHHLHLGARHAMRYLTPLHQAQGEHNEVRQLQATVLTGSMVLTGVVVVGLLVLALGSDWPKEVRIGLGICAVTVLLNSLYDHFTVELKSFQKFRAVSLNNYMSAVVSLAASVVLILWLGFYGALLAEVVMLAVMLIFLASRGVIRFHRGFDWARFKMAVALGGPTMLFNATLLMMRTTDRIVIVNALGYEQLGYYALGAMMMGYVMNIPGATREVMEAKLFENLKRMSSQAAFDRYVMRPMKLVGLIMPILIGPVVLVLPVLVSWLLPKYTQGILATQILMIGGYFMAISFPLRGILAAYGWQKGGAGILLCGVGLHVALSMMLLSAGFGIEGVAVSAGVSFFAAAAGLFAFVVFRLPERPKRLAVNVAQCLAPFPLMLLVLWALLELERWLGWSPWAALLVQLSVFGLTAAAAGLVAARTGLIPKPRMLTRVARSGASAG